MDALRSGLFSRAVSAITAVAFSLSVMTPSWADALDDAAKSGQEFGQSVTPKTSEATADPSGNITLFPDSSAPMSLPAGSIFPGATGDYSAQTAVYGDDAAMNSAGGSAQTSLATDPSLTGDAYRVLTESSALSRPDLRSDPIWGQTDDVNNNLGTIAKDFGDCSQESKFKDSNRTVHVPDYQTCERVITGGEACHITHDVNFKTMAAATVYLGTHGVSKNTFEFDLKNGSWKTIAPSDGDEFAGIVPVVDYQSVCGQGVKSLYQFLGTAHWYEAPVRGKFDDSVCYKVLKDPTCDNGLVGQLQIIDNCSSGSGWYKYGAQAGFKWVGLDRDTWGPDECLKSASDATSGYCSGVVTPTDPPVGGCQVFGDIQVCEGDVLYQMLSPPPVAGVPALSGGADVADYQCNFWQGNMECWVGADGVRHCPAVSEVQATCASLENNPKCGFISSECTEGAKANNGTCFVKTETWDCGYDQAVPQTTETTTTQCAGPIRCMGGDCVNQTREASGDFYRAAAALDAAAYVGMDGNCGDLATGGTCKVFGGNDMECKKAVGGIVNCCEKPDGVSLTDYITMLMAVRKLDGAIMASSMNGTALQGSWEMLRQPITNTWSAVKQPFSSAVNSMMGKSSPSASPADLGQVFSGFKQDMMNQTAEWVGQTFGDQAKSALFSPSATNPANYMLNNTLSTVVSGVMTAYMIYQVTMILIQLIWQCEEDEFELGAKRALKSCHFVGSYCATKTPFGCIEKRDAYCCFSAPLSRILQEQIRPQLGLSWGEAENPECGGIPVEQLANVDWSKVNLDEWIGILAATGNLNTPAGISMDSVTGSGNFMNIDGQREDTATRTVNRLNGIDTFGARQDAGTELFAAPR